VDLKLERPCIDNEFISRLNDKPFTSGMILIDDGRQPPDPKAIPATGPDRDFLVSLYTYEAKGKRRKPKTDRGARQAQDNIIKRVDPNQHRQTLSDAFNLWREPGSLLESELATVLPAFPNCDGHIKMLAAEREFWEGPIAKIWRDGALALLQERLPILRGEREAIPRLVRSHRQSAEQKERRHRKMAAKLTPDSFHQWLENERNPNSALWQRHKVIWALKRLDQLHPRVGDAANFMFEGMTMREAAEKAKVSPDTIRKYFDKLQKSWKKQK
jgi:hypothetical protein